MLILLMAVDGPHRPPGQAKVTFDVCGHLLRDANPEAAVRTDDLIFSASEAVQSARQS